MAIMKLSTADRTAIAAAILAQLDAEAGPAYIEIYDGTQPASVATAVTTQVKLGTLTCSDPAGVAASGALTFDPITQDSSADASGTATWARIKDAIGTAHIDLDVTVNAGTGSLKLNTTSIVAGGPIGINSLVITIGGA